MKLYVFLCIVCYFIFVDSRPLLTLSRAVGDHIPKGYGSSDHKGLPLPGNLPGKELKEEKHFDCDEKCQRKYLIKYGYIRPSDENNVIGSLEDTDIKQGIFNLQKEAGLEQTGIMDSSTANLLQTPRCGVQFASSSHRQKRFTIVRGWDNNKKNQFNETMVSWYLDLSNFDQIKTNMERTIIEQVFSVAMGKWSNTSLLSFNRVYNENEANITIKFLEGKHGDGYDFDGPGQVLAHAFYPNTGLGGDAHFDLGEKWTIWDEDSSISLFSVAIHEIGHSLGLGHSSQVDSIMYAWYRSKHTNLDDDDILAINSVYGVRPEYRFVPLDPKHRIYKPQTSTTIRPTTRRPRLPTTTQRYNLNKIRKLSIENSRVYIYPKTASLNF